MSKLTDRDELLFEQYKDGSNLDARIRLHQEFSTAETDLHRWLFERFEFPAGARVLEVGCGTGTLWKQNEGRVPFGLDVTLTDFSPGMLEAAKRALRGGLHEFTYETADVQDLPFGDGEFDVVVANHMLYHVPDRETAFAEIRRVLKPDGTLYASTGGENHMREIYDVVDQFSDGDRLTNTEFTLQNGADQLSAWFDDVELLCHQNALEVTEVEPFVDYVASSVDVEADGPGDLAMDDLRAYVEERIADDGSIHVTKENGLFVARSA